MRLIPVTLCVALLMVGCSRTKNAASETASPGKNIPAKLDKWSWLPKRSAHEAEASQTKGALLELSVPKDDPLQGKSNGWGSVGVQGEFIPTDKKGYTITGGALVSTLGPISRKAKYGDWDFVYADDARTKKAGWGPCLTAGEVLLPRKLLLETPADKFVQNSFAIETFGDDYVLVSFDPAKDHRLCFLDQQGGQTPTAAYIGTKAEVNGKILERKVDGWYDGTTRVSE